MPWSSLSPTAYSPPSTPGRVAIGLHSPSPRVCTGWWAGGWAYADVITKISCIDRLPKFLTHGAPLARFARRSSARNPSADPKKPYCAYLSFFYCKRMFPALIFHVARLVQFHLDDYILYCSFQCDRAQ